MKNRSCRTGLMLLFAAVSLTACQEYEFMIPGDGEGITTEDPEITAAREWYDLNKFQVLEVRSGGQHSLFAAMEPNWVETYTRENDGYKTVESALLTVQSRRRILPECHQKYQQTGDVNYLQCMTRMVIRTDLGTGRTVGFFMMILPSVRYLETTKFKPFYGMTYIDRDEKFDGEILYYELDGQFANGWCYLDGEIIHAIREPQEEAPLTRGGQYVCHKIYEITCTDYHTVTEFEDQLNDRITGSSCITEQIDTECRYIPDSGGSSGSGGSGGGSGSGSKPDGEYEGEKDPQTGEPIKKRIELMNPNYFYGFDYSKDCMTGCKRILDYYNVAYGDRNHVYQLLVERNEKLEHYGNNPAENYTKAVACINRHLEASRPIIVGVNYQIDLKTNEGTTDHWIVVTGRGYDISQKLYYYTYINTGNRQDQMQAACNTELNRLYYNPYSLYFKDDYDYRSRQLDVTQVRPNDGNYLSETITQPSTNIE